ncbi:hypothetical protein [Pedosphaera parvula]|uniref:Uncharacterized protein n=1 Tax=Pedosphaera parvula (strain Ellin514) TaxID=320771 RepID=B9XPW3_PEDPL|nr:hypothetical protein [Pedosphaera parvula]EEF58144.1 hypothetical protein Cflav_PD1488 [Pedosphaera parvula Ellin514]
MPSRPTGNKVGKHLRLLVRQIPIPQKLKISYFAIVSFIYGRYILPLARRKPGFLVEKTNSMMPTRMAPAIEAPAMMPTEIARTVMMSATVHAMGMVMGGMIYISMMLMAMRVKAGVHDDRSHNRSFLPGLF